MSHKIQTAISKTDNDIAFRAFFREFDNCFIFKIIFVCMKSRMTKLSGSRRYWNMVNVGQLMKKQSLIEKIFAFVLLPAD